LKDSNLRGQALGMVETRGFIPMIEAADAMSKSSVVGLTKWVQIDPALCTAMVRGDVGAVTAAVEAGAAAAKRLGEVVRAHVIPMPWESLEDPLLK
jgi:microcompartment protein CcmL/EutN